MGCCLRQSWCCPYLALDRPEKPCGIAGNDFVWEHVFGHNRTSTDDGVFANHHVRKDGRSRTDRGTLLDQRPLHVPVLFCLQSPSLVGSTWIRVVDKRDAMTDKDIVF